MFDGFIKLQVSVKKICNVSVVVVDHWYRSFGLNIVVKNIVLQMSRLFPDHFWPIGCFPILWVEYG